MLNRLTVFVGFFAVWRNITLQIASDLHVAYSHRRGDGAIAEVEQLDVKTGRP